MTDQDEFDDELRRLFADERLDVHAGEDAPARIVAGARRIRRRRAAVTAASGAVTVVALVTAGLLLGPLRLSGHTTNEASPLERSAAGTVESSASVSQIPINPPAPGVPSSSEPSSSTETPPSSSQTATRTPSSSKPPTSTAARSQTLPIVPGPVLGPSGYSKLTLGMSFADAKDSGLLANADTAPSGCATYKLTEGSSGVSTVTISDTNGIVGFDATGAHTPERIRVGSTKDELETAYPNLNKSGSGYAADAGSGGSYLFAIDGNRVSGLSLVASASC
ncbi:hypothetical protein [Amycolatopsis sp. GM8]|uniref:hypothetical protein n=1 Tax=Amycolatopsis sp. GM8 TaxID=2896530 RepID=UPI001F18ECF7|nr:hypothetical protein [Amycolatopsis sp. GM8]